MLMTLVFIYWSFLLVSFGTLANLLYKLAPNQTVLIITTFLFGHAFKVLAEYLVFQKKQQMLQTWQEQSVKNGMLQQQAVKSNLYKENV